LKPVLPDVDDLAEADEEAGGCGRVVDGHGLLPEG
jgi:hypothetical protein